MTTGQRIRAARIQAGLTQKELAQRLNIPFQGVSQWENDIRNPKIKTLQRIAAALDISIMALIDPVEVAKQNTISAGVALSQATQRLDNAKRHGASQEELQQLEDECKRLSVAFKHAGNEAAILIKNRNFNDNDAVTEEDILTKFRNLNADGKRVALERVGELAEIHKYRRTPPYEDTESPLPSPETPPEDK